MAKFGINDILSAKGAATGTDRVSEYTIIPVQCDRGYRYIQISCNNKDCNAQQDVIITDMAELREHRNESEIIYKIHDAIV